MRVFSFGGGVQSTACLVLAARGEIDYRTFLFANVGDDSEHPNTLRYVREVAMPYAERHGITLHELRKVRRTGNETLLQCIERSERSVLIPMYLEGSGAPGRRRCTGEFKIQVIARWLREHGATRDNPASVGLGISLDEYHRARTDSGIPYQRPEYPLIERRLSRADCHPLIQSAGLPTPPKSACWFCPFSRLRHWQRLRREHPALFERATELETLLAERGVMLGRGASRLTPYQRPLASVVGELDQLSLWDQQEQEREGELCETGYCWT